MEKEIREICTELNDGKIAVVQATEKLLNLFSVVGQSEQLPNSHCGYDRNKCVKQSACKYPNCDT